MTQTQAFGHTLSQKYGELGGYSGRAVADPAFIRAFIFGLPGDGKSALLQSNPDCYLFNLDTSSTVTNTPRATLFPSIDPTTSRIIGDGGQPVVLDWDLIRPKIDILKKLAATKAPRPSTICFDSLTTWIRLLRLWIPRNAKALCIANDNCDDWKQLHGPAAYDAMYDLIVKTIFDLSNCGYGVYVIGHVVNATIAIAEDKFLMKPELTITDGFWKRLQDCFELSALVCTVNETESYDEERKDTIRGETKISIVKKQRQVRRHILTVNHLQLDGICKTRVTLPDRIVLPKADAWAHFSAVYREGMKDVLPATPF